MIEMTTPATIRATIPTPSATSPATTPCKSATKPATKPPIKDEKEMERIRIQNFIRYLRQKARKMKSPYVH